jgi:endonuclease YncB( thermonuclease family)
MLILRLIAGLLAVAVLGLGLTASAQTTPTRLRGSITAIDGKTVTIAVRDGTTAKVKLADNWTVNLVLPLTLADIKQGSYVGIASTGTDADRIALEVLVFPDAMRGAGEGHYAWDLQPQSMMTNATVATVASASDGQTLKLEYKGGGTQTIKVKPGTPIVTFQPGQRDDAKVGAKVFVIAQKAADGSMTAARIAVGKDGLTPPM